MKLESLELGDINNIQAKSQQIISAHQILATGITFYSFVNVLDLKTVSLKVYPVL